MDSLETIVVPEKLNYWCQRLPECKPFLQNFFISCKPYTWQTNMLNYMNDIYQQKIIDPEWEKHEDYLLLAFFDITDTLNAPI